MKQIRYEYLVDLVRFQKPKTIVEIGLARGVNSCAMMNVAPKDAHFIGYDVFDTMPPEWHKMVGNGKKVDSQQMIESKLKRFTNNITLVAGLTEDTLWNNPVDTDFTFIDGDHRIDAIRKDFEAINSKIYVFDDYYPDGIHSGFSIDEFGCNAIVEKLDNVIITSKTVKIPQVRLAVYIPDDELFTQVKEKVNL
ncbi:MAG: class I SAM-dependent methyltransferase [Candidatus Thiodiazotropha taylori]|uniref:Class I SAM-dependent methyltransferase n=1 Tax=Candidatus Thiodiazotropha taylori TaxID=2792791 RepID=A0A9E4K9H3_9GAMM|nr:class I SAM-dependent methyltransferase [Candidatus Thiodiazotropha taylori]MCW4255075.1 class I SAM-dependent methyltransferase [Candidatus Thiodiazotropha taylori]